MITLKTKCKNCIHNKMCKNRDNAETDMNKLKNMNYGKGPNDDYTWEDISNSRNVNIVFSCPDYMCDFRDKGGVR